jgi:hypothetical protein
MTKPPFFIGGIMMSCGFFWAAIRRIERPVSCEFVTFYRREQMARLRMFLTRNTQSVSPSMISRRTESGV